MRPHDNHGSRRQGPRCRPSSRHRQSQRPATRRMPHPPLRSPRNGVEAGNVPYFLPFLHAPPVTCACAFRDIRQGPELIHAAVRIAFGLLVKVLDYVRDDGSNALGSGQRVFPVNSCDILVLYPVFHADCLDVVNAERQDVMVVDCIHNRVGMELFAKGLIRRPDSAGPRQTAPCQCSPSGLRERRS